MQMAVWNRSTSLPLVVVEGFRGLCTILMDIARNTLVIPERVTWRGFCRPCFGADSGLDRIFVSRVVKTIEGRRGIETPWAMLRLGLYIPIMG